MMRTNRFRIGFLLLTLALSSLLVLQSGDECDAADWSAWQYAGSVFIDNTANPATLTDYQVQVNLDATNFDFMKAQANGEDIRFADSLDNSLSYWIEEWDSISEYATIWVKAPSIPASGIGTVYIYYGNPGAFSESSFNDVFDACNTDFEFDAGGVLYDAITDWDHESGTNYNSWNGGVVPGSSPSDEELSIGMGRYFTGSKALYSMVENSNSRVGSCTSNNDPDCRGARHWAYTEDSYRLVANSDTLYIWTTSLSYSTPSRYQWAYGIILKDGVNYQATRLAHRVWHGSTGWGFQQSDIYDMTATGADNTTWKRYPISIPGTFDKTNLTMEIRHFQGTWDGGTAYSSLYWD